MVDDDRAFDWLSEAITNLRQIDIEQAREMGEFTATLNAIERRLARLEKIQERQHASRAVTVAESALEVRKAQWRALAVMSPGALALIGEALHLILGK